MSNRLADLERFYELLGRLERALGGTRTLTACRGRMDWPLRGVYFFFEDGEERRHTGRGPRVVRVGTHALTAGSQSTLRGRLSQHRGQVGSGSGNHRGSIFRLLVGAAIKRRDGLDEPASWGVKGDPAQAARRLGMTPAEVKASEHTLEQAVSRHIGAMQLLWLPVDDDPGPESVRGLIERNAIALLSNHQGAPLDPPSSGWLGLHSDRERVVRSGLWNNRHVDERHDPKFLNVFGELIDRVRG